MADTTALNGQITDAVSQANVVNTGIAPAHALATSYLTLSQSLSLGMQNAVAHQKNGSTIGLGVTVDAIGTIFGADVAAGVRGTNEVFSGNQTAAVADGLRTLLRSLKP